MRPVCKLKCSTRRARFTLSVKPIFSSKLAMINFFSVCIELSTAPVSVCSLGGLYSKSIFLFLQNSSEALDMNTIPLSNIVFSGTPYSLTKPSRNLMTSLALVDLHVRTTSHLLYRKIPIRLYGPPVTCLLCNLPERSIFLSRRSSVNTGGLIFSVTSN